jgi:23S rRNA (guanosine2251-2'-O)-methyltransferase
MQKNVTKNPKIKTKDKFQSRSPQAQGLWLCGKHPTFSALQKKRRKIFEILASKNSVSELENFLAKNALSHLKAKIKITDNQHIEALVGKGQIHQGLALNCSPLPIKNQNDLLTELYKIKEGEKLPTLLLLDQISDPHNVGAIIRSAVGFGVNKIIFCEHNAPKESATIVKTSAGTIESAELFAVINFSNLFEKLKKIGYWCIGLDAEGAIPIQKIKDYKNIALIIGSEGAGIRDLVKKNCDILAKIEIDKTVESLNASVAAAVTLYELSRL